MASVAFHLNQQLLSDGEISLFEGSDGYENGDQRRDFIHIEDVVKVNLWFLENVKVRGIFNVGTGKASTFNGLADAVIDWHGRGNKRYIPFPETLIGSYQSFTQADIEKLRTAGYKDQFMDVNVGIKKYLDVLNTPDRHM